MLTYTYISKGKFGLVEKPKPTIQHERDAIVKVTLASICSSDLHIKHPWAAATAWSLWFPPVASSATAASSSPIPVARASCPPFSTPTHP